jgi:hypothetical protein
MWEDEGVKRWNVRRQLRRRQRRKPWWTDGGEPEETIRFRQSDVPYEIGVDVDRDGGSPVVVGLTIRRLWRPSDYPELPHVSARDIQRLPLAQVIKGALVIAADPLPGPDERVGTAHDEWPPRARKVLVPRGQPRKGHSSKWYRELADAWREFERQGLSPAKEIAKQKGVDVNTVHQWAHRMRYDLGLLEPPPGKKRKKAAGG